MRTVVTVSERSLRLHDVETECLSLRPHPDRTAHCLGQQTMAKKDIVEAFIEQHVERLAQRRT